MNVVVRKRAPELLGGSWFTYLKGTRRRTRAPDREPHFPESTALPRWPHRRVDRSWLEDRVGLPASSTAQARSRDRMHGQAGDGMVRSALPQLPQRLRLHRGGRPGTPVEGVTPTGTGTCLIALSHSGAQRTPQPMILAAHRLGADELACKPDPVPGHLAALRSATIHLGLPSPTGSCDLPAGSDGPPSNACAAPPEGRGLLVLLRVGFTEPPRSPGVLVVSYTTVSPLPRSRQQPGTRRSVLCGTVPRVAPGCR